MKKIVLDHGYVEFVEAWGHGKAGADCAFHPEDHEVGIIEAARQSTQGNFRGWDAAECDCDIRPNSFSHSTSCASIKNPGDKKLLKFLQQNKHATPFEFSGMTIEVQAPIFVFREWHRHRTQSYNEMSARYTPLPDLYYLPDQGVVKQRTWAAIESSNKQAGSQVVPKASEVSHIVTDWLERVESFNQIAERHYQDALAVGIPKELARLVMPVGHYTRMRASANLRNWLGFLTLRQDPKAQWEIRQYANAVAEVIQLHFPQTYDLFAGEKN